MKNSNPEKKYVRLHDVDWQNWTPQQRATLTFVMQDSHILLIHKKRGLGAGKINGPGGRIDPGETALACAVREVQEELKITPLGLSPSGILRFQFVDGLSIHVQVFTASDWEGEPMETDEAAPLWTPLDRIPYDRMWEDDRIWIPHMLAGNKFEGRFLFDDDRLLEHELEVA
ncbi:8-oxo-dGTP diphosphatase [bacterium]|nr:8-oxo-dGTP diphosphatase [bacterium]RIK78273.1 MAG: NUDIX hydrolase [candidate division KSB1 bacterium]